MPFSISDLSDDDLKRLGELAKDEKTRERLKRITEAVGDHVKAALDDILINGKPLESPYKQPPSPSATRAAQQEAYGRFRSGTMAGDAYFDEPPKKYPNGESSYARAQRENQSTTFSADQETFDRYGVHFNGSIKRDPPVEEPPLRVETHEEYNARMEREQQARKAIDPVEAAKKHGLKDKVYEPPFSWTRLATGVHNWTQAVGGYNRLRNIRRQAESTADLDKRGQDGYVNVQIDVVSPALDARIQRYTRKGWTMVVDHNLGQWLIRSPRGGQHYVSFINPDTGKRAALAFNDALQAWLFLDQLMSQDRH